MMVISMLNLPALASSVCTAVAFVGVVVLVIASAVKVAFVILLILGLCPAAAPDVREDTGEYE
jgi:hypothetical protein